MTEDEKLAMLEVLSKETDTDELSYALTSAADKLLRHLYPYDLTQTEVPDIYAVTQVRIANYLLSKRGAEGQSAHSENGISRTYEDTDVPASLLRDIPPMVGVIGS